MLQEWHINADLHHPRAEAWHLAGTAPTITADVLQQVPTWPRRLDEHSAAGHFVWGTCADGRGCRDSRDRWETAAYVGGENEKECSWWEGQLRETGAWEAQVEGIYVELGCEQVWSIIDTSCNL